MHYIDIIVLLVLVVVVFVKLRSVLGTRPEMSQTKISKQAADKIFDIIVKEARMEEKEVIDLGEISPIVNISELNDIDKKLLQIPNFNKDKFINSSKKAFEMIVSAFSKGDVDTLDNLVSKSFIKKMKDVIEARKEQGISAETDFIGFNSVEIEDVKVLKSGLAKITMTFVSEQINILRDVASKVIEGDENFIQKITDVWTFEKNIRSGNPAWLLASTKK